MDEKKVEDVMLPGFRFHPTDEELVGFYLKKKIQGRPLPIELIKQVDIYKYDPWDLPKFATTGEKEWYYYCPRDRKYRNSARPNRVTGAGFWKATGTDRPIYSSTDQGTSKCIIGLKKSLVFYRGRAAKGMKTDWMMHEFRLPPIPLAHHSSNKLLLLHNNNNIPPNDSWAICRIFKKTNTMAQRGLSHSWAPHFQDTIILPDSRLPHSTTTQQLGLETFQLFSDNAAACYLPSTTTSYAPSHSPSGGGDDISSSNAGFMFDKCTSDTSLHPLGDVPEDGIDFAGSHQFDGFSIVLPRDLHVASKGMEEEAGSKNPIGVNNIGSQWSESRSISFPFSLPWDSPTCPTECFSTNKCYS